jgi:hypothetical protein
MDSFDRVFVGDNIVSRCFFHDMVYSLMSSYFFDSAPPGGVYTTQVSTYANYDMFVSQCPRFFGTFTALSLI